MSYPPKTERNQKILATRGAGLSLRKIAAKFRLNEKTVREILEREMKRLENKLSTS